MRPLVPVELSRMRNTQTAAMFDTCIVHRRSMGVVDALGTPGAIYTAGEPERCGYKPSSTREANQDGQVVIVDAVLRMGIGTVIGNLDRVEITHRFSSELAVKPLYSVIGQPALGPSGLVINLALVTDE